MQFYAPLLAEFDRLTWSGIIVLSTPREEDSAGDSVDFCIPNWGLQGQGVCGVSNNTGLIGEMCVWLANKLGENGRKIETHFF